MLNCKPSCRYWKPTFEPYRLGLEGRVLHPDGAITDVAWAPTDTKFVTASTDHTLQVMDLHSCEQHVQMHGAHARDVRSVDWHPMQSLVASGSNDSQACGAIRGMCCNVSQWMMCGGSSLTLRNFSWLVDNFWTRARVFDAACLPNRAGTPSNHHSLSRSTGEAL